MRGYSICLNQNASAILSIKLITERASTNI